MKRMLQGIGYMTAAVALAFAVTPVERARAEVTYNYVGQDFLANNAPFTSSENITGTISFAAPLADNLTFVFGSTTSNVTPASFSFTGGPLTLASPNFTPSFTEFQVATDSNGNITSWAIVIGLGGGGQINIDNVTSGIQDIGDQVAMGSVSDRNNVAGQFTIAAAVPEPSTWAMMLLGFFGIGAMTYRRRKSAMLAA
jgi:hypothetical protein